MNNNLQNLLPSKYRTRPPAAPDFRSKIDSTSVSIPLSAISCVNNAFRLAFPAIVSVWLSGCATSGGHYSADLVSTARDMQKTAAQLLIPLSQSKSSSPSDYPKRTDSYTNMYVDVQQMNLDAGAAQDAASLLILADLNQLIDEMRNNDQRGLLFGIYAQDKLHELTKKTIYLLTRESSAAPVSEAAAEPQSQPQPQPSPKKGS